MELSEYLYAQWRWLRLRGSWLRGSCLQRLWLRLWWRVDRRLLGLGLRRRLLLAMEPDPGALGVRLLLSTIFCDKFRA